MIFNSDNGGTTVNMVHDGWCGTGDGGRVKNKRLYYKMVLRLTQAVAEPKLEVVGRSKEKLRPPLDALLDVRSSPHVPRAARPALALMRSVLSARKHGGYAVHFVQKIKRARFYGGCALLGETTRWSARTKQHTACMRRLVALR